MTRILPLTLFFSVLLFGYVLADEKSTQETEKITYEDHVKPIFRQHCLTCHNQGDKKGGLALDSYAVLLEGGGSGEVVYDDGDVDGSRLWQLMNHDDTPIMPPNQDKLPAEQLTLVRKWIEGGVLENLGSKAKVKKNNTLAFEASSGGKPDGPVAMPQSISLDPPIVTERPSAVTAIGTSPWAPLVAIAGQRQIVLYHTETGELLGVLPFEEGVAHSLRFSRDGSFLIAGGGTHSLQGIAAIYDVRTGERVVTVGDELDVVFDADANSDMTQVAMGGPQRLVRIYDTADGEMLFELKKHTDWVYAVAYSPDGVLLASGDRSAGLVVWEADTGRIYLDLAEHKDAVNAISWRDDSNVFASASDDGTVKLWDVLQGKVIKSFNAHGGGVMDVMFDHQGRLVTAGKDNRVKLWDASGNHIRDLQPTSEMVLKAAISHDGSRIIYGDWTGLVYNALAEKPEEKQTLATNPPSITTRIEQTEQQLASVQQKLSSAKASWDESLAQVNTAQQAIDDLNSRISMAMTEAEKAREQADAATKNAAEINGKLKAMTSESQQKEAALTQARSNDAPDKTASEAIAAAEQSLAELLSALAALRRQAIDANDAVIAANTMANSKKAEAEKLPAGLAALQEKLDKAKQVAESAKQNHEAIHAEQAQVQQQLNKLTAGSSQGG